jgi:hypothetical protein
VVVSQPQKAMVWRLGERPVEHRMRAVVISVRPAHAAPAQHGAKPSGLAGC